MRQPGRHLAQCRQMLSAGHLRAVQTLNFFAILPQLLNHFVEMPSQIADLVIAVGKIHIHEQVASREPARSCCCNSSIGRWITTASTMKSTAQMATAPATATARTRLRAADPARSSVTSTNRSSPFSRTSAMGNNVLICQFSRTRFTSNSLDRYKCRKLRLEAQFPMLNALESMHKARRTDSISRKKTESQGPPVQP